MNKILVLSFLALGGTSAFAQQIDLQPGSSVVINGQVIACAGAPANEAPICHIEQDGYYYRLYADSKIVNSYRSFELALEDAKKMKEAGLCR